MKSVFPQASLNFGLQQAICGLFRALGTRAGDEKQARTGKANEAL